MIPDGLEISPNLACDGARVHKSKPVRRGIAIVASRSAELHHEEKPSCAQTHHVGHGRFPPLVRIGAGQLLD